MLAYHLSYAIPFTCHWPTIGIQFTSFIFTIQHNYHLPSNMQLIYHLDTIYPIVYHLSYGFYHSPFRQLPFTFPIHHSYNHWATIGIQFTSLYTICLMVFTIHHSNKYHLLLGINHWATDWVTIYLMVYHSPFTKLPCPIKHIPLKHRSNTIYLPFTI